MVMLIFDTTVVDLNCILCLFLFVIPVNKQGVDNDMSVNC